MGRIIARKGPHLKKYFISLDSQISTVLQAYSNRPIDRVRLRGSEGWRLRGELEILRPFFYGAKKLENAGPSNRGLARPGDIRHRQVEQRRVLRRRPRRDGRRPRQDRSE